MTERLAAFTETYDASLGFRKGDLLDYDYLLNFLRSCQPDAIVRGDPRH